MTGYSATPLVDVLGIKPNSKIYIYNPPDNYFEWLAPFPEKVSVVDSLSGQPDFIHLFISDVKSFQARFTQAKNALKKGGTMWVSWPTSYRGSSDLNENVIRSFGVRQGMVDTSSTELDDNWHAIKFVFRLI